jgi:CTP:molybdopterin cytidylyltransferase MocA
MEMRTAAIIPVAGLSSRMGAFKPLMPLNGFAMIRMTVQAALDGGVTTSYVVTGRESKRISEVLQELRNNTAHDWDNAAHDQNNAAHDQNNTAHDRNNAAHDQVNIVPNHDFSTTDMLHSIKIGIRALLDAENDKASIDAIFVVPGDIPAVSPRTFGLLRDYAKQSTASVIHPSFKGKRGHPLLLKRECFDPILAFDGEGGLKGAIGDLRANCLDVADEGIALDADDMRAFERLAAYARATKGLAYEVVDALLVSFETPRHIREHGRAVGVLAARMARHLNNLGFCLDSELCRSAGELHDMNRLQEHHAKIAAEHLRTRGYEAVAKVVGDHHTMVDDTDSHGHNYGHNHDHNHGYNHNHDTDDYSESLVVFLADKLVKETKLVTLDERYAPAFERFPATTAVGRRIRLDKEICGKMLRRYTELTGDRGAEAYPM